MNRAQKDVSPPITLSMLGAALVACWWAISALGDVRVHLGAFYGWFGAAFLGYLVALWCIARWERDGGRRATSVTAVVIGLFVAVLARGLLLPTTPVLSNDIYRYLWDGRVQLAGTTVETTIRIVSHMKQQKILTSTRGSTTLRDPTKLAAILDRS